MGDVAHAGDVNDPDDTSSTLPNIVDLQGTATRASDGAVFSWAATVTINQSNRGLPITDPSQPGAEPDLQGAHRRGRGDRPPALRQGQAPRHRRPARLVQRPHRLLHAPLRRQRRLRARREIALRRRPVLHPRHELRHGARRDAGGGALHPDPNGGTCRLPPRFHQGTVSAGHPQGVNHVRSTPTSLRPRPHRRAPLRLLRARHRVLDGLGERQRRHASGRRELQASGQIRSATAKDTR